MSMTPTFKGAAATLLLAGLALAGSAQAQSAGALLVRAGATQIKPDVKSGDLTAPSFAGTQADIKSNTQPTGRGDLHAHRQRVAGPAAGAGLQARDRG
jgi:outer membrane protein